MPPKKLSKAERQKRKQEEAERKAREEEERRLREEEEERERQEKERLEREEAARKKALQDARIAEETLKVKAFQEEWNENLEIWKHQQIKKKEWEHFMSCSQLPLVMEEKPLNSWISEYRDAPASEVEPCLAGIKNCLTLSREVQKVIQGDGMPALPEEKINHYQNTIQSMQSVILSKLSSLTHHCGLRADSYLSLETYNMTLEVSLPGELTLCLWGNVGKNPRLNDFSFEERCFTLELPKPLILADVLVSVLYPPFDYLTPLARSFSNGDGAASDAGQTQIEPGSQEGGSESREGEVANGKAEGGEGGGGGTGEVEKEDQVVVPDQPEETLTEATEKDKEGEQEAENGGEGEVGEEVEGDAKDPESEETRDREEDEVDLRHYRPVGGPIILSLLQLPPPPKNAGQWTIRKVVPEVSQTFVYPQELTRVNQQVAKSASDESTEGGVVATPPAIIPGCPQWPPFKLSMSLPKPFHYSVEPLLAQWDNELNIWRTERVKEVNFDMEENSVTFQTYHFSPIAIMTDIYANMPYKSWKLSSQGEPNHSKLTLTGALVEVVIDIKDTECWLVEPPEEVMTISHLVGQPMTSRDLLVALRKCGVNCIPECDGHKYCSVPNKRAEFEAAIYQHMVMAAASYEFNSTKWNSQCGRGHYIMQCNKLDSNAETQGYYICGEDNWRLAWTQESTEFNLNIKEGSEPHGDLYSTLLAECSTEKLPTHSPQHMETLYHWLSNSRPLTYTQ